MYYDVLDSSISSYADDTKPSRIVSLPSDQRDLQWRRFLNGA